MYPVLLQWQLEKAIMNVNPYNIMVSDINHILPIYNINI